MTKNPHENPFRSFAEKKKGNIAGAIALTIAAAAHSPLYKDDAKRFAYRAATVLHLGKDFGEQVFSKDEKTRDAARQLAKDFLSGKKGKIGEVNAERVDAVLAIVDNIDDPKVRQYMMKKGIDLASASQDAGVTDSDVTQLLIASKFVSGEDRKVVEGKLHTLIEKVEKMKARRPQALTSAFMDEMAREIYQGTDPTEQIIKDEQTAEMFMLIDGVCTDAEKKELNQQFQQYKDGSRVVVTFASQMHAMVPGFPVVTEQAKQGTIIESPTKQVERFSQQMEKEAAKGEAQPEKRSAIFKPEESLKTIQEVQDEDVMELTLEEPVTVEDAKAFREKEEKRSDSVLVVFDDADWRKGKKLTVEAVRELNNWKGEKKLAEIDYTGLSTESRDAVSEIFSTNVPSVGISADQEGKIGSSDFLMVYRMHMKKEKESNR